MGWVGAMPGATGLKGGADAAIAKAEAEAVAGALGARQPSMHIAF